MELMMRYHIYKATRLYEGRPYAGPANQGVPAQADVLCDAIALAHKLSQTNPVGWRIWDTLTGHDVDNHKEN
jgi:hypothetical protein